MEVDTPSDDEVMTLKEVAEEFGLSLWSVRIHVRLGVVPSWKRGKRIVIRRADAPALRDQVRGLRRNG